MNINGSMNIEVSINDDRGRDEDDQRWEGMIERK
jgi:hypothetical protein